MFFGLRQWLLTKIGRAVMTPWRRRLNEFERATHHPRRAQESLLQRIVQQNADTDFGKAHHFASIANLADFRKHVPVSSYDYIAPYIDRVKKGDHRALLSEGKVHMFALTSGTTAARKFIPVTDSYLEAYRRSWNVWSLKVLRDHPEVRFRSILQISGDFEEMRSETGVPCGAVTGLTATMQNRLVRWFYCVPPVTGKIKDSPAKYYTVLRLSIPRPVGILIAANPSNFISMARLGDAEKETLIKDVHDGTLSNKFDVPAPIRKALAWRIRKNPKKAAMLEDIVRRTGTLYPKDYWDTKRTLMGNWMGGSMTSYLRHYPKYFGDMPLRDIGLIASEGRMTIPVEDGTPAGALDVLSHFFEFIPEEEGDSKNPTVLTASELQPGKTYYIILTTSYGLYRYNIFDVVRFIGLYNKAPLLEFLSKGSHFSNITGEKISEYHITSAMADVQKALNLNLTAFSVAPCWDDQQPFYGLFIERGDLSDNGIASRLAQAFDRRLAEVNHEYDAKRQSRRLGPLRVEILPTGAWQEWDRTRLKKTGGTLEQYKHPSLIPDAKFRESVKVEEEVS